MASITISCEGTEQKYALESPTVTLGRGLESDIRLKDIKASRRHCQIVKTPQGYQCLDLSSGNGTFINGVQIKQQPLSQGDKIQIGSTTITFNDGAAAQAGAAKPKTAAVATGGKPPTARAGAGKPATAVLPAAPTRKITAKIDVVKPPTASVPKPGTQSLPKVGTQAVSKAPTAAIKKTTQRMGSTTRATGKVSATQKFHAEGRKKKTNPIAVIIGVIGCVFVAVVALILFSGGDDVELVKAQIAELTKAGAELDDKGHFDQAIAKYKEAMEKIAGKDAFKTRTLEIKNIIVDIEKRKADLAGAFNQFAEFKGKFEKATDEEAYKLWQEGKALYDHYTVANLAFLPELKTQLEKLDNMARTRRQIEKRMGFQERRQEITDKCKLTVRGEARYGEALKLWQEYLSEKPTADNKNKAENEIRTLNTRANEEVVRMGKRMEAAVADGKKDQLLEELKKERPRFEGTANLKDLDEHIKKLEGK